MRVLLIEDDLGSNRALVSALQSSGAVVEEIDNGEEALQMARVYDYDLILLGLILPDIDGYEVVRRMRAARIETPVMMMSDQVRPQVRVKAFAMGVDDFLTRPFDTTECVARVRAIVRRSKGYSQPTLRIGDVELSLDTKSVSVAGKPVHLTGKEYSILELLVMRKGMVLTKDVFLNHLYGGMDEPEVKIIDVFICKLRKKLAEAGAADLIGTVWGRGYTVREPMAAPVALPALRPEPVRVREQISHAA